MWEKAGSVHADHDYVRRKQIKPYGAKQLRAQLVIKIQGVDGAHHSSQYIQPEGSKTFQTDGRISGCFAAVTAGVTPGSNVPLLICDGYATASTLHEATGRSVAAAMNAGNLLNVARAWREKFPHLQIVICADDDIGTDGNPGMTKAVEAARAVDARVAVPDFGQERPAGASDFNDLHCLSGLDGVRRCIDNATSPEAASPTKGTDIRMFPSAARPINDASVDTSETDEQAIARLPFAPSVGAEGTEERGANGEKEFEKHEVEGEVR
ncbi:toprim domain-containing protein [Burkholderia sp. Nafp2/4-1b]|uniref:toprim domain-containing protein n=1 Tax=Burkholderia sp. Nafp2/4-1b TaxID=2116686 RepID=UPI001F096B86|nr:toprim domain-containing protein [Burkholderia sp. Nafp2/4-1b]